MKIKGAIMFHQYNNVIKIKLTRPAVSALWIGAAEGNCEGKIILGSRTIALDDINCAILQSRPADLGSREQFNAAGVVVSAYKYSLASSSSPSPRSFPSLPSHIVHLNEGCVYTLYFSYQEYLRVCRDVGACPRA